jgi:hypothetical protein
VDLGILRPLGRYGGRRPWLAGELHDQVYES